MSTRSPRLLEIRRRAIEALERLAEKLDATIYLFGSIARGDHTVESDVDIVVVSDRFQGLSMPERVRLVRLLLPDDMAFDIIALTPEELEELKGRPFYRHISSYWIRIEPTRKRQKR